VHSVLADKNHVLNRVKCQLARPFLPLLLPPPDIRRNFLRNCCRVGLKGGDGAVLFVVGTPDVDSIEYCLDSIDGCLGD
jgi:hypothetical protein